MRETTLQTILRFAEHKTTIFVVQNRKLFTVCPICYAHFWGLLTHVIQQTAKPK